MRLIDADALKSVFDKAEEKVGTGLPGYGFGLMCDTVREAIDAAPTVCCGDCVFTRILDSEPCCDCDCGTEFERRKP